MQEPPAQPFNDPALKAALRRALDQPSAPAALRDRIRAMAVETRPAAAPAPREEARPIPLRPRGFLYKFAVAAVLILGVASLAYQVWQMNQKPKYDYTVAIPDSLYEAMVQTHTARASAPAGGDSVASADAAASLGSQIKRPVLAADLA
jgi:hypothetical protein